MSATMGRTGWLVMLVVIGLGLLLWIEPPHRKTGAELARGPRALRIVPGRVTALELRVGVRRTTAARGPTGWTVDGRAAAPLVASALDDLVAALAGLRAVDAFRTPDFAAFGLDPPAATITVTSSDGVRRLALGKLNATGATVYARRDDHPRVLRLGVYLLSVLERVLSHDGAAAADEGA